MSEEQLLTVAQVAEWLKVSPATIRKWLREGRMHGVMPGGTKAGYRIRETEVERILTGKREVA